MTDSVDLSFVEVPDSLESSPEQTEHQENEDPGTGSLIGMGSYIQLANKTDAAKGSHYLVDSRAGMLTQRNNPNNLPSRLATYAALCVIVYGRDSQSIINADGDTSGLKSYINDNYSEEIIHKTTDSALFATIFTPIEVQNGKEHVFVVKGTDCRSDLISNLVGSVLGNPDTTIQSSAYNNFVVQAKCLIEKDSTARFVLSGHSLGGHVVLVMMAMLYCRDPDLFEKCEVFAFDPPGTKEVICDVFNKHNKKGFNLQVDSFIQKLKEKSQIIVGHPNAVNMVNTQPLPVYCLSSKYNDGLSDLSKKNIEKIWEKARRTRNPLPSHSIGAIGKELAMIAKNENGKTMDLLKKAGTWGVGTVLEEMKNNLLMRSNNQASNMNKQLKNTSDQTNLQPSCRNSSYASSHPFGLSASPVFDQNLPRANYLHNQSTHFSSSEVKSVNKVYATDISLRSKDKDNKGLGNSLPYVVSSNPLNEQRDSGNNSDNGSDSDPARPITNFVLPLNQDNDEAHLDTLSNKEELLTNAVIENKKAPSPLSENDSGNSSDGDDGQVVADDNISNNRAQITAEAKGLDNSDHTLPTPARQISTESDDGSQINNDQTKAFILASSDGKKNKPTDNIEAKIKPADHAVIPPTPTPINPKNNSKVKNRRWLTLVCGVLIVGLSVASVFSGLGFIAMVGFAVGAGVMGVPFFYFAFTGLTKHGTQHITKVASQQFENSSPSTNFGAASKVASQQFENSSPSTNFGAASNPSSQPPDANENNSELLHL